MHSDGGVYQDHKRLPSSKNKKPTRQLRATRPCSCSTTDIDIQGRLLDHQNTLSNLIVTFLHPLSIFNAMSVAGNVLHESIDSVWVFGSR